MSSSKEQSPRDVRMDWGDLRVLKCIGESFIFQFVSRNPPSIEVSADSPSEIKKPVLAVQFLEKAFGKGNQYLHRLSESQVCVPMLVIQSSNQRFSDVRGPLSKSGSTYGNIFSYNWPRETGANSSHGILQGSLSSGRVLFETPLGGNGPYMFLCLAETQLGLDINPGYYNISFVKRFKPVDLPGLWNYRDAIQGVCMYSEDDFNLKDCLEEQYRDLKVENFGTGKSQPFHFIAARVVYAIIIVHLDWSRKKAELILRDVESIEQEFGEGNTRKISDLTASLNRCSREIRHWDLDKCRQFDTAAIRWMNKLLEASVYQGQARVLIHQLNDDQRVHPNRLRERIAEVQALLKEEVIRQQQEQSSELQRKLVEQQEQMKKIQEESFKLAERLAKETENDRLANRAREKANAELTKLSTSIARQSLELARETRRDSRTMRGIGWVTMGFLPATFVASFFGMNFFTVTEKKPYFESSAKSVWIFFLVAVPISAVVLWQFHRWDAKSEKEALLKEGEAWKKIKGRVDESA